MQLEPPRLTLVALNSHRKITLALDVPRTQQWPVAHQRRAGHTGAVGGWELFVAAVVTVAVAV